MKKNAPMAASLLLILMFAAGVSAQQTGATLSGRVMDPMGAVIPNAQVTVTQKSTGIQRQTQTDGEGLYVLTNLPAGEYEVRFQAMGFAAKVSKTPLTLEVGQSRTLNADMEIDVKGTVIVDLEGSAPLIDTSTSKVDQVISAEELENLPLNGRNFLELSLLVPGNSPAPNFDPTKSNTVAISSAGQLGRGGNVTVDGADNNDDTVGGMLQNISQEAVQEFQIATNRFSAELGRSGSAVVNIVTKTGTNELRGSGSFYWRDRRLQGLPATFDRASGQRPPFDREQYALALGGPIRTNRAWWFGSFEYRNQDGAVLVGARDTATRTIRRSFAPAPLNDLLGDARFDWQATDRNSLSARYSIEREDDIAQSTLDRTIGSASQRQAGRNNYHTFLVNWTSTPTPRIVNNLNFSVNDFFDRIEPVTRAPQLTFPSLQDGASFRVPQQTSQRRFQLANTLTLVTGSHTLALGGQVQRVSGLFNLGVFQQGRVELVQDFPDFDHNGDGRIDDNDLLFAVTLRSGLPDRPLVLPGNNNTYLAFFAQDDWRATPRLTLNLGLRYELDTNVKNVSRTGELNPLVQSFLRGQRKRDTNNFGPRLGFNWSSENGHTSLHGGYGIYYDRVTLEIMSLERGLDGRQLPIEVRAGNLFFLDPATGRFPPFAPTISNPFTGFILPGAGAAGINIIDNDLQNPMVQQMNLGIQRELTTDMVIRADYLHNFGTHFIIGRTVGTVFNPVVGGPDIVKNLESSVKTKYDALLLSLEKRFSRGSQFRLSYTLSKAFNYANDDQIPFSNGPINSNNLQLEYGPTPNDQRHRLSFSGIFDLPAGLRIAPLWTLASGVPMDILLPDGSSRIPQLQRNAGGRLFHTGAELNDFLRQVNAAGGVNGKPLPLVRDDARFSDNFNSLDVRVTRPFKFGERTRLEPIVEVFNLFNVTNVLGVSNRNYSGFSNVLGSADFGQPVTTAGGIFGSGGPRAFQLGARFVF